MTLQPYRDWAISHGLKVSIQVDSGPRKPVSIYIGVRSHDTLKALAALEEITVSQYIDAVLQGLFYIDKEALTLANSALKDGTIQIDHPAPHEHNHTHTPMTTEELIAKAKAIRDANNETES